MMCEGKKKGGQKVCEPELEPKTHVRGQMGWCTSAIATFLCRDESPRNSWAR